MPDSSSGVAVIMSVYGGADPAYLGEALQSLVDQTLPPDEVVVAEDGPLTEAHDEVLGHFAPPVLPLKRVRLPVQSGSGPARQAALRATRSTWVAVADADDISLPTRLQLQRETALRGGFDVVGSAMVEFSNEWPEENLRTTPLSHEDIMRRSRSNNPFNHPTAMFRTELALEVGGYTDLPYLEDYDLCARLLAHGARGCGLAEPLVRYRVSRATLQRRKGRGVTAAEVRLQLNLHRYGLVSEPRAVLNFLMRTAYRLLPLSLRRIAHQRILSRPIRPETDL